MGITGTMTKILLKIMVSIIYHKENQAESIKKTLDGFRHLPAITMAPSLTKMTSIDFSLVNGACQGHRRVNERIKNHIITVQPFKNLRN